MEQGWLCLAERINEAFFLLQDEKIVFVNSALARLYGFNADDLVGRSLTELLAPRIREAALKLHRRRLAGEKVPYNFESAALANDGTIKRIKVAAWIIPYQGEPAVAGIDTEVRERKVREAEIPQSRKGLRLSYAGQVMQAQEEERRRVARELHDTTIQELLYIGYRLQDIAAGTDKRLPNRISERLAETRLLLHQVITGIRHFTQVLRPAILDDMGLISALRWLTDSVSAEEDRLHSEVRVVGEERYLSPETELMLFRIAQEALSNVRRHAAASGAILALEFGKRTLTMSVSDNGRGFEATVPLAQLAREGKLGLVGINERVHLLGGTSKIESCIGKGTIVKIEIPT